MGNVGYLREGDKAKDDADGVKLKNMHRRRDSTFSFVSACNMNEAIDL